MQYGREALAIGLGQGIVQSKYSEAAARALAFSFATGGAQAAAYAAALDSIVEEDETQCRNVGEFLRGAYGSPGTCNFAVNGAGLGVSGMAGSATCDRCTLTETCTRTHMCTSR
jgi:hypothetical protein